MLIRLWQSGEKQLMKEPYLQEQMIPMQSTSMIIRMEIGDMNLWDLILWKIWDYLWMVRTIG